MPRRFTETERAIIREKLLTTARELLPTYGVRKTSVDDLVRAVGISKGAFYSFFESKEALFLTLFYQFEQVYRSDLLALIPSPAIEQAAWLRGFFEHAVIHWRNSPLFRHFNSADYAYLTRTFPAEAAQAALDSDREFVAQLLRHWEAHGLPIDCNANTLAGLMRALFFMTLNTAEIGEDAFPAVLELLIDGLVLRLLPRPARPHSI